MVAVRRFDIAIISLDPTVGSEVRKTRPCAVISPDEPNGSLRTLLVAPMTTGGRDYPWCVLVTFQSKHGHVALDQLRAVDQQRLTRVVGRLDDAAANHVLRVLGEMFPP